MFSPPNAYFTGTLQLAILAQYNRVPFFVAVPTTSIDLSKATGQEIEIEERPPKEMLHDSRGARVAAEGIDCWNPAFDVTPAHLITGGLITEFGVFTPSELAEQVSKHIGNNNNNNNKDNKDNKE